MVNKILHIATDEKFINAAMYLFNAAFPNQNYLRIIVEEKDYELVHVDRSIQNLVYYNKNNFSIKEYANDISDATLIIFHNIDPFKSDLILSDIHSSRNKLIWSLWGAEIYNNVFVDSEKYISSETKRISRNNIKNSLLYSVLKRIKRRIQKRNHPHFKILKAIEKVDGFIGLQSDYNYLIKSGLLKAAVPFINFSYYPIEYIAKNLTIPDKEFQSDIVNVLIGNSATTSNNHIDVFFKLTSIRQVGFSVSVPLSYGDDVYRKKIIDLGYNLFGEKFNPIVEFLNLNDYNQLLGTFDIAIMNHYRQQGVGNIITLLWLGVKVFLNSRSTLYKMLLENGFIIFDFNLISISDLTSLTMKEKTLNKNLIEKHFSSIKIIEDLKGLNDV